MENMYKRMENYLTITIAFNCNNYCSSCMLDGMKEMLVPVSFERYKKILDENGKSGRYKCLIISGAEVTISHDIIKFAEYARDTEFFENIRIQTNGRRLSDMHYCKRLIAAGINEFFISLYGHDRKTHEALTRAENSFHETMSGLKNLNELNARVITNTVITRPNCEYLSDIVENVSMFNNIKHIEFWNYWPMKKDDTYDLLESNTKIQKYLLEAMRKGEEKGLSITVKGFPECLLNGYEEHLDNTMSRTIIDDLYWRQFCQNEEGQCRFKEICESTECKGVTGTYLKKFGASEEIYTPI